MNILFFTAHPAQIHNFRYLKTELQSKEHNVFWVATNKDISQYLLDIYDIDYTLISRPGKSVFSKVLSLIQNTIFCWRYIYKHKIDIIISRVSPYAALAGFLTKTTHIALADTESSGIYNRLFSKFVSSLFTAKSFRENLRKDQIRFDGNIELFYLNQKVFKPLDKEEVLNLLGIECDESYIIMRFVGWDAYHDKGLSGFTEENKIIAVKEFSKFSRVFISSEKQLSVELESFRVQIPPERMHDVLFHANLFFGESATMASESVVLGTPAIFLDEKGRGYTDEEEDFGLLFHYRQNIKDQEIAISKGLGLLKKGDLKRTIVNEHNSFLRDKIDPISFFVWFIENWPESSKIMEENPSYQYKFQ